MRSGGLRWPCLGVRAFSSHTRSLRLRAPAFEGVKVIEMAGTMSAPFCGQLLADQGANVTVVHRPSGEQLEQRMIHGKISLTVDLKRRSGIRELKGLCQDADVLIDSYRPGVMERLGVGPVDIWKTNPSLIYARITGFGQTGPLAKRVGHEPNFAALSGILPFAQGPNPEPWFPPSTAGMTAGLMAAFAIAAELRKREKTGEGSVIDCSITDILCYLSTFLHYYKDVEPFSKSPNGGLFSGRMPFYRYYRTLDNKFMAVAAIEREQKSRFLKMMNVTEKMGDDYLTEFLELEFKKKPQAEWMQVFRYQDAAVSPVLDLETAPQHEHLRSRHTFNLEEDDRSVPSPQPRFFSRRQWKKHFHREKRETK